jgi:hypothetical protein
VGSNVKRLQISNADAFQAWYRDPFSTCGNGGFNTTGAVQITWQP